MPVSNLLRGVGSPLRARSSSAVPGGSLARSRNPPLADCRQAPQRDVARPRDHSPVVGAQPTPEPLQTFVLNPWVDLDASPPTERRFMTWFDRTLLLPMGSACNLRCVYCFRPKDAPPLVAPEELGERPARVPGLPGARLVIGSMQGGTPEHWSVRSVENRLAALEELDPERVVLTVVDPVFHPALPPS